MMVPREWEWIWFNDSKNGSNFVCSTRVGVNRMDVKFCRLSISLSHASGNESGIEPVDIFNYVFVPREWEWIARVVGCVSHSLVCPTHVGMYRSSCRSRMLSLGLSRTRGNGSIPSLISWLSHASVPLTWEWIVPAEIILGKDMTSPTHVGMNLARWHSEQFSRSLSHVSGNESIR